MAVNIRVPFWVLIVLRHLIFREGTNILTTTLVFYKALTGLVRASFLQGPCSAAFSGSSRGLDVCHTVLPLLKGFTVVESKHTAGLTKRFPAYPQAFMSCYNGVLEREDKAG